MNKYIIEWLGKDVDQEDPSSWKYYKNLAGEFHFTNVPMEIVSMDTLEKIYFNKENLVRHRATKKAYAFGTRQYEELVLRFPEQEILILGILYPVSKAAAIEAKDGVILGFPPGLVEENEYSFIQKLQEYLDAMTLRWWNPQYGVSDPLFPTTFTGIIRIHMVPAILNIHLEACRTNEANSFHVRQYLKSHGLLDSYLDYLTLKQSLFFYRNIKYIHRNAGQKNIFTWLVEHIMTERNLPLAEYTMRHELEDQPNNLYPKLSFRRKPVNLGYSVNSRDVIDLEELLDKEDAVARDNVIYKSDALPVIKEQMENSPSNVLMTKVLESTMVDYTDNTPYTIADIMLNHWLFLSSNDRYVAIVGVTHPVTGDRIPLTAKEAWCFMWYCYCTALGVDLIVIPQMQANRVQRIPTPTVDELMSVVDKRLVSRATAELAISIQPHITTIISIDEFNQTCYEIFKAANLQRNLRAFQEHMDARGYVNGMIQRIYSVNLCTVAEPGETYAHWLAVRNIDVSEITKTQYIDLFKEITAEATGLNLTTTQSVKDLQRAMLQMLSQLSSYSVQYLRQINDSHILPMEAGAMRVGDQNMVTHTRLALPILVVRASRVKLKMKRRLQYDINGCNPRRLRAKHDHHRMDYEMHTLIGEGALKGGQHTRLIGAPIRMSPLVPLVQNDQGVIPVMGIDSFLTLTPEQKASIRDFWV